MRGLLHVLFKVYVHRVDIEEYMNTLVLTSTGSSACTQSLDSQEEGGDAVLKTNMLPPACMSAFY